MVDPTKNHPLNTPIILIKDKATENTIFTLHSQITYDALVKICAPKENEAFIVEDENHNVYKLNYISPPCIIFVCKFTPYHKIRKRRPAEPNLIHTPIDEKPKSRHNSIVI